MHTMTTDFTRIERIARPALEAIGDQVLLSQGRCVDVLLDLYCATDDVGFRALRLFEQVYPRRGVLVRDREVRSRRGAARCLPT